MKNYLPDMDQEKMSFVLEVKEAVNRGELTLEEGQKKLRERVTSLTPQEIAYAEQELREFEDNQCEKEDIQGMLALFQGLIDTSRPKLPEDHPIARYYQENDALRQILLQIEDLVQYPVIKNQWYEIYDKLKEYKLHMSRKQNQLYSVLEKKGFDRPTTTMWTLDDFVLEEIGKARELLEQDEEAFIEEQSVVLEDIRDLMEKEEEVLYPTSLAMISKKEFEDMKEGDFEIGFAWISVQPQEREEKEERYECNTSSLGDELVALLARHGYSTGKELDVSTGKLTLEQINLIYKHMPVDISYVDEHDIVKFYTDTDHRVFPRSKNVIGRNVANCHPRKSVHIVEEILEKFRSGEQDQAEFWINKPGLFIYIYYKAVRDENGAFRGVLEMMQDCTHIRELEGSRTLLTWDDENQGAGLEEQEQEELAEKKAEEGDSESKGDLEICPETKLKDLLERRPQLKEELAQMNPAFKMLNSPLARVMIPKADVRMMAERSGMDLDTLITKLKEWMK